MSWTVYFGDAISRLVKLRSSAGLGGPVIWKVYLLSVCILNKSIFVKAFPVFTNPSILQEKCTDSALAGTCGGWGGRVDSCSRG